MLGFWSLLGLPVRQGPKTPIQVGPKLFERWQNKVLGWSSQSPDPNPIENQWWEPKVKELEQFAAESYDLR